MKLLKQKSITAVLIVLFFVLSLLLGVLPAAGLTAFAAENTDYGEGYRNRISYSALKGWNNDPNGLLYCGGVWHMYYQYTWNEETQSTKVWWDDMSWGHATSTDLIHWEEQPVAIPAYRHDKDGNYYAMMFSGSAVYDEYNTSGLFDIDEGTGKVVSGQGIVAVLTQPLEEAGGQRQILAYSKDNGTSFEIYGEILGARDDGGLHDGEFRDPKVFWSETHENWLMAVGGGSIRMYTSENLTEWDYLGETGYWGECPDLSRFEVEGEEKYVLVCSPEDKENSHIYNGTSREDTYYPAEYYVVGHLDEDGLFIGETELTRLSEGIDSYAFQSFNNTPDGKVYGVSWSASWKTVSEYESFRKNYNGGMTVITELNLTLEDEEYVLTRTPVEGYEGLRDGAIKNFDGELKAGENALAGATASVADLEITLDFSKSDATQATLLLRSSELERITLSYDLERETLTLDRSESSLLAGDTTLYRIPYSAEVPLIDGKLNLRILLDRAFISVFANGGRASFFSAVFPMASSNGMSLTSDGDISVKADVYAMNDIFGGVQEADDCFVTASNIYLAPGEEYKIYAYSFGEFDAAKLNFEVLNNDDGTFELTVDGALATVKALKTKTDAANIRVWYDGIEIKWINVYVHENGFVSNIEYTTHWGGTSYLKEDGVYLSTGESDAFLFSNSAAEEFYYSAEFTPENASAQAAALVFGVSDNFTGYWVVTADATDHKLKLWRSGVGDLVTTDYYFKAGEPFTLSVSVMQDKVSVFVNGAKQPNLTYELNDYHGGKVGLNAFNAAVTINNVVFTDMGNTEGDGLYLGDCQIYGVLNLTDAGAILTENDYHFFDGVFELTDDYLLSLYGRTTYHFKINTSLGSFEYTLRTSFSSVSVMAEQETVYTDESVTLSLSRDTLVNRVLLGGKEVKFTQEGRKLIIDKGEFEGVELGDNTVTVYSSNGRSETQINLSVRDMSAVNNSKIVSIVCMCAVLALAAACVGGYFLIVKLNHKKRENR
ncbi:MAG: glycoside hydrolase family 32 protein [Clostridia bacterium]|nr:glycoside hydrolase family 32 protein [Clostridia bacterium]